MAIAVKIDYSAPATASSPDGSATFPLNTNPTLGPLPTGATALSNSSGNQTAATATATLTSAVGRTAYLGGFEFLGTGATATSVVSLTITGVVGGPLTYPIYVPGGVTIVMNNLIVEFSPPLPATATNTSIVVSVPSLGAGSVTSGVVAHGYMI